MKGFKKGLPYLLLSYVIVLCVNISANYTSYAAGNNWKFSVFFSLGMATFCYLWFGVLNGLLFRRLNMYKQPTLRILTVALIFAIEGALMMLIVTKVLVLFFHLQEPSNYEYINNSTYSALISLIIGLMVTGQKTLQNLKKNIEDNEHMKQEMIQSRYETLKSQVNPHFLFNSLNTLTVMIPTQPDIAVSFVEQLSKVFRYSLQHSGEHTIDLAMELKVVRSYLFLNEQRYGSKLAVDVRVDDNATSKKVITQSLLMLVENAIKHNELSHENPLAVRVYNEGNYLVVQNTLQRKTLIEESTHVGLENIKKRYDLATALPVVIDENDGFFTVKIPLLP